MAAVLTIKGKRQWTNAADQGTQRRSAGNYCNSMPPACACCLARAAHACDTIAIESRYLRVQG